MAGDLLLGVDIGTYSAKGVIATPAGDLLATATIEHDLSLPHSGWAEHDPETVWWGGFTAITRALLGQGFSGDDIGAIAVSAIGACLLPVDAAGNPLRAGILYGIDTRATDEIAWLNGRFGEQPIFELGGMALTSQAIGPKILWLERNEPEVFERTAWFLAASSFLVQRLTGEFVMDHHTASYYTPLYDLRNRVWSEQFAEPITKLDRLPRLLWSTAIAGEVTPAAARETGLRAGTPVTAGTIDAAAEAVSVGVVNPGDMMVMYGTTMFFIHVTGDPAPDERMWATVFALPGVYAIDGGMSTTGALTRWFRDNLGQQEMVAEAGGGPNAYEALAEMAATIEPGSNGLLCLPYFAGERTPINDPDARGVYAGLTLSHTRAHLYRASLEGTAFGVRHNLETMTDMGAPPPRLVAVGGGAKNPTWLQIVSDVTGLPQDVPEQTIGAAYGDAFLAGLATGRASLQTLRDAWVRPAQTFRPNPDASAIYDEYYPVYRALYESAKDQLHALARLGSR